MRAIALLQNSRFVLLQVRVRSDVFRPYLESEFRPYSNKCDRIRSRSLDCIRTSATVFGVRTVFGRVRPYSEFGPYSANAIVFGVGRVQPYLESEFGPYSDDYNRNWSRSVNHIRASANVLGVGVRGAKIGNLEIRGA
jgi:hypothetical protein